MTRNVPDHALVFGNPAKQIGWMCICGERLSDDLECLVCGNTYERCSEGLSVLKDANEQQNAGADRQGRGVSMGKV